MWVSQPLPWCYCGGETQGLVAVTGKVLGHQVHLGCGTGSQEAPGDAAGPPLTERKVSQHSSPDPACCSGQDWGLSLSQ